MNIQNQLCPILYMSTEPQDVVKEDSCFLKHHLNVTPTNQAKHLYYDIGGINQFSKVYYATASNFAPT